MHFVIYLPKGFYAVTAATVVETLQAVNEQSNAEKITYEFVSGNKLAKSKSGIFFNARTRPAKTMDVLILLASMKTRFSVTKDSLHTEIEETTPLIKKAREQGSVIVATCGASYILASFGLLNGKNATISWWLKKEAIAKFPEVKWKASQILVQDGNIYTSGGGFSGLEMITTLLSNVGFADEVRKVRKLLVFPPVRQFQSPYEFPLKIERNQFEDELNMLLKEDPTKFTVSYIAEYFGVSSRTLTRKFQVELEVPPGKWIQQKRIELAITLLEETDHTISEICFRVGYEDISSFTRLFTATTGMTPTEYRRQAKF